MYCLISLFAFSFDPFPLMSKDGENEISIEFFAISLCPANPVPLSEVMEYI